MSSLARIRYLIGIGVLAVAALPAPGAPYLRLPVKGYLAGEQISTTVDSALAKYYLENSPSSSAANSELDQRIADIEQRFGRRPLDWLTLGEISAETSPDFATLFFINQSLSDGRNAKLQKAYRQELNRINIGIRHASRAVAARKKIQQYDLIFIQGFNYLCDRSTGADFYTQRRLFRH